MVAIYYLWSFALTYDIPYLIMLYRNLYKFGCISLAELVQEDVLMMYACSYKHNLSLWEGEGVQGETALRGVSPCSKGVGLEWLA